MTISPKTTDDLRAFFAVCDAREEEQELEPDWEEHVEALKLSKRSGIDEDRPEGADPSAPP